LESNVHYLKELRHIQDITAELLQRLSLDPMLTDTSIYKEAMLEHNRTCDAVAEQYLEHRAHTIEATE